MKKVNCIVCVGGQTRDFCEKLGSQIGATYVQTPGHVSSAWAVWWCRMCIHILRLRHKLIIIPWSTLDWMMHDTCVRTHTNRYTNWAIRRSAYVEVHDPKVFFLVTPVSEVKPEHTHLLPQLMLSQEKLLKEKSLVLPEGVPVKEEMVPSIVDFLQCRITGGRNEDTPRYTITPR